MTRLQRQAQRRTVKSQRCSPNAPALHRDWRACLPLRWGVPYPSHEKYCSASIALGKTGTSPPALSCTKPDHPAPPEGWLPQVPYGTSRICRQANFPAAPPAAAR